MTADIVNLNKFRKARERADAEQRAEENRVRHGRTKAEKEKSAAEEQSKSRALDHAELTPRGVAVDDDLDPGLVS
ncbi:MAG: DUF4169 family protein [Hyphomicrobium sp.]